jgi:hypothetical protein
MFTAEIAEIAENIRPGIVPVFLCVLRALCGKEMLLCRLI